MTYDELLRQAEKPARYTGGEYNSTEKRDAALKFLICFPDVYEVAMSNLGWKILYHELNEMPEVLCERCFAPFPDFGDKLRAQGVPLCSLESRRKMTDFEIVGFSLQFELCYTNVLYMLELGGIPFRSADRGEEYPLVVAGGPCAYNVEPVADFFDLFMIGEGEDCIRALSLLKLECKTKDELLTRAAREIEGVYVPKFVRPVYESGRLSRIESDYPGAFPADRRVTSRDVKNGKPHPEPYIRAMQLANVRPSAAIAIENAPLGVRSADAAGAFTVGVVTGPVPREELERAGAAIVFDSMPQCADLFPYLLYTMVTFINQDI